MTLLLVSRIRYLQNKCLKLSLQLITGDDNYYTLLMLDVSGDAPDYVMASPTKPFAHWVRYNIEGLDLATGVELKEFAGTAVNNNYVFVLYKQQSIFTLTSGEYDDLDLDFCWETTL